MLSLHLSRTLRCKNLILPFSIQYVAVTTPWGTLSAVCGYQVFPHQQLSAHPPALLLTSRTSSSSPLSYLSTRCVATARQHSSMPRWAVPCV